MSMIDRREFVAGVATAVVAGRAPVSLTSTGDRRALAATAATLAPLAYTPLPLGAIRPQGWLARQLRIHADGLTGNLDTFWPDVGQSQWFGGSAEGWERAPYWLDGAIPTAWILGDERLKARIVSHVSYIVDHQRSDGWFSVYPVDAVAKRYDMWAILLANKVLAQYHDATGDQRVLDAVTRSLRALNTGLDRTPLYDWGRTRWYEGLIPIYHVYARRPEPWLLDLAGKLRAQGVDYEALFATDDLKVPTPRRGMWKWTKHVVNTGMAVKAAGLSWRLDQRAADRAWPARMIEFLDRYHGQATGMFSGDECLSGRNPVQGTELCAVVEFMYSLEVLLSAFGDPLFGDRLERVAFNALPAAIAPDSWSHQYDQQVNQVQCTINPRHGWSTNGPESNLFGLEPNYGCCTANMHQGWPKLIASLWMKTPDDGIAAMAYGPSRVSFTSHGVPVEMSLETDYPFRDELQVTVTPERAVRFPLELRVPSWANGATIRVAGGAAMPMRPGTMHRVERDWSAATSIAIRFPMSPVVTSRYNNAVSVERGPLVYSLKLGEEWTRVNVDKPHRELPHADWEVRPTTPWNYGLAVTPGLAQGVTFEERPVGEKPFSPDGAGVVARAPGRRVPLWKLVDGWAGEISSSDAAWADGSRRLTNEPVEQVELIPYGCTNIRITEFPRVDSMTGR